MAAADNITQFPGNPAPSNQEGVAVLIALGALSLFSLLGLYMMLNATTDLRISDNHEAQIYANYAALAGLNYGRILLRGLSFDDQLCGPDGKHDSSPAYLATAKLFGFRNPLSWNTALSLNVSDPADDLGDPWDDGLLNSGYYGSTDGVMILPRVGVLLTVPNPYGPGALAQSRFFVKVTDNNGESSELEGDPTDNPFLDGDGVVIMRSMGVAQTIRENLGALVRRNTVVVYEARYQRKATFDLPAALVIQGSQVEAAFDGNAFTIDGGAKPGIGAIDSDLSDGFRPSEILKSAAEDRGNIVGGGLPSPSVADINGLILSDADRRPLLDPAFLRNFIRGEVPRFADYIYEGDQIWSGAGAPYLGAFDVSQARNAPEQNPKAILVNGNLSVIGRVAGGGLLVVTGDFECDGGFEYSGLVLVIGKGRVRAVDLDPGISGGLYIAAVSESSGAASFGISAIAVSGSSTVRANENAVAMAISLIPPSQISFREITSAMDP